MYDVDGTSVLSQLYYHLSKTLAEQAALKFAEEHGIDLVTLHPGFVLGPLLQPVLNITSEGMLNFIKKGKMIPSEILPKLHWVFSYAFVAATYRRNLLT